MTYWQYLTNQSLLLYSALIHVKPHDNISITVNDRISKNNNIYIKYVLDKITRKGC